MREGADPFGAPSPGGLRVTVPPPYAPPIKRSVTIAGHQTAISLEPIFWDALRAAAAARMIPINALIAQIDVERIAVADRPNLTSAIRCWLFAQKATAIDAID